MISPDYLEQNRLLHETVPLYGAKSAAYLGAVTALLKGCKAQTILDYGCGKGGLVKALQGAGFNACGYDPAVEEYSAAPQPAELVICTDVLEHVEPEFTDTVLADLARLSRQSLYTIIATTPAKKDLPDGRNAHLVVESTNWWVSKLMRHFQLFALSSGKRGFVAVWHK